MPSSRLDRIVDGSHSCNREGPRAVSLALQAGHASPNLTVVEHLLDFDRRWNSAIKTQTDRVLRVDQKSQPKATAHQAGRLLRLIQYGQKIPAELGS